MRDTIQSEEVACEAFRCFNVSPDTILKAGSEAVMTAKLIVTRLLR